MKPSDLQKTISKLRDKRYSVAQLAHHAGVSPMTIRNWSKELPAKLNVDAFNKLESLLKKETKK